MTKMAMLFILLITDTSDFNTKGEVSFTLIEKMRDIPIEQCMDTASEINLGKPVAVGNVTAVCFPQYPMTE